MIDWVLVISSVVGAIFLAAIVFLRFKTDITVESLVQEERSHSDPNVEYQWITEPQGFSRIFLIVAFVAGAVYALFSFDVAREFFSRFYQVLVIFLGFASAMFSGLWKKTEYKITDVGLMKKDLSKQAAKKKPELVFSWRQLSWIRPKTHGFRYYLKELSPVNDLTGVKQMFRGGSGYINAGRNAMVVNAIIMSRGVPTSPSNNQ